MVKLIDRIHNRIFNRKECLKLKTDTSYFEYNDVIYMLPNKYLRYLGKGWFKITDYIK